MGRPIEIAIDAKTKDAETGIARVADSLDEAGAALDDLGKTSRKAGDVVETSLKDAGKQADKLDRDLTTALDDAAKSAKRTGDSIGDNVRRGARDADEGVSALRDNTASNAKEMGASFQDVGSAIDSLQGLMSEALEGFGPAGIAAGVTMAIGIGIAQQALQAAADKVNEIKTTAGQMTVEMTTQTAEERLATLQDQVDTLSTTLSDSKSWWEVWQKDAKTQIEDVAAAITEGVLTVTQFNDVAYTADVRERAKKLGEVLDGLNKTLDHNHAVMDNANRSTQAYAGFIGETSDATEKVTQDMIDQTKAGEGVQKVLQGWKDQADAQVKILEAQATAAGMTTDAYLAHQQAVQRDAGAQAAAAQKLQQAADDRASTLKAEDDAYRSSVASIADLDSLLGDAWADPNSPLRKWAEAQAKATAAADDTWQDFQDKATPAQALAAVMAQMDQEIAANNTFAANLQSLAERGFGALAEDLRQGGPKANGAIVQALKDGTDDTVQQFAMDRGTLTGKSLIAGSAAAFSNDSTLQNAINGAVSGITPPNIAVTLIPDDTLVRQWAQRPVRLNAVARVGTPQAV